VVIKFFQSVKYFLFPLPLTVHLPAHPSSTSHLYSVTCCPLPPVPQRLLQETKRSLDEYKAVLRERTKELQKCEQQRKQLEKQKTTWSLEIKELLHNMSKVQKDSRDAVHKVCLLIHTVDSKILFTKI